MEAKIMLYRKIIAPIRVPTASLLLLGVVLLALFAGNPSAASAKQRTTISSNEISSLNEKIRETIDQYLLSTEREDRYSFQTTEPIDGWVMIAVQFTVEGSSLISEPTNLLAYDDLDKGWIVYPPWDPDRYNTALSQVPETVINNETKELLFVSESYIQYAPRGGFLFPWDGNGTIIQSAHESTAIDVINLSDILAPKDGIVISAADDSTYTGGENCRAEWTTRNLWVANNYVLLGHGRQNSNGSFPFYTLYYHLKEGSIPARIKVEGNLVRTGEKIGEMGDTGASTQPHLHFVVGT